VEDRAAARQPTGRIRGRDLERHADRHLQGILVPLAHRLRGYETTGYELKPYRSKAAESDA